MTLNLKYNFFIPINSTELQTREEVAACYRLMHLYGTPDFTDGFASCRIPGTEKLTIGGYALLPKLARASGLYRRRMGTTPTLEKFGGVDRDAYHFTDTVVRDEPISMPTFTNIRII